MTDVMPEPVDLGELVCASPAAGAADGGDGLDAVDEQLIDRLVGRAREGGLQLTGEGGLLAQLTKRLVESALEGELTDHLSYDRHAPSWTSTLRRCGCCTLRQNCGVVGC